MKDESKYIAGLPKFSAKRINNSTLKAYSSSYNIMTPTSNNSILESSTLLYLPIHKKESRKEEKERLVEIFIMNVKFNDLQDGLKKLMFEFARTHAHIEGEKAEIERKRSIPRCERSRMIEIG